MKDDLAKIRQEVDDLEKRTDKVMQGKLDIPFTYHEKWWSAKLGEEVRCIVQFISDTDVRGLKFDGITKEEQERFLLRAHIAYGRWLERKESKKEN